MKALTRAILILGTALLSYPALGLTQEPLGVVTTLTGRATRTAQTAPDTAAPLRFKDGVFGADTIRTAEHSFVRMLLERKAVLTVRELSVLRISDEATQAAVDLHSGGIAFSVARPRLRPGESLLIHTPNAVAAVRGTSIVVETHGAVSQFHVLTGTLDVASRDNPTGWQRLQAPASLTVTGDAVGTPRGLDGRTRDRLNAEYLGLRVTELSAPAEVLAQEQAKAVLLARLISGDGSGGDQVELLTTGSAPDTQGTPGMQSPTQVPVTPQIPTAAPAAPTGPLHTWSNETATVTGDLLTVPGTLNLTRALAGATSSTVTVTNEIVDVTGTLTAGAAAPFVALQSSTLAARTLASVQTGSLTLNGGSLLQATGSAVSTSDDLLRVTGGGDLIRPGAAPLLSLSGTSLNVGNGAGDRLLELTGAGSRVDLGGALLSTSGSTVSLTGTSLVEVTTGAALNAGASPLVGMTGGGLTLNSSATGFLFSSATGSTLGGGLLQTSGTPINTGVATPGNLLSVSGPLASSSAAPLFFLTGGDVRVRNVGVVSSGAGVLTLGGAFLDRSGAGQTLVTTDDLLNVSAGGRLVAPGAGALVRFTDTTAAIGNATGDHLFEVTGAGSAATLGGSLLRTTNTTVTTTGDLASVSGSLTDTGTAPLLDLTGGTVASRNGVLVSTANGRLNLDGPALARTGGTLTTTDDLVSIASGGRLVNTDGGALLGFSSATVNVGNATSDQLFVVTGTGSAATLAGPVIDATSTAFTLAGGSFVEVSSAATLTSTAAAPLAILTGSDITTTGNLVTVSGQLTGAGALLDATGGALAARTGLALSSASGQLSLSGPVLTRSGGTLVLTDDLFSITTGGRLTDTAPGALLDFTNATVTIGNAAGDQLFVVNGAGSQATLAGPLLVASGGALSLTGTALVEVSTGGTLTDTATAHLVSLSGGTLTLNGTANAFLLNGAVTATLAGGLLEASGTDITAGGDFVRALAGARLVVVGSTDPLLSLNGGTHQFAAAGSIYRLSGTATALDPVSGLTLGTEQPIQAGGPLLDAIGATATTQRAVRLDVALLQASAPLLSLRANGAVGSQLTTTSNTIDLTSRARLNATAPVIALDGSRLTVAGGSLVNVAGGSYLGVTGNLLSVANGSQISVANGTLLFAASGSVVNISGALIAFGGAGNTVTVSNALCPCAIIGGLPVRLSGGALAANVSITSPVKNAAGNTLSIAPGAAAIRVDGAATRLTISGQ